MAVPFISCLITLNELFNLSGPQFSLLLKKKKKATTDPCRVVVSEIANIKYLVQYLAHKSSQ